MTFVLRKKSTLRAFAAAGVCAAALVVVGCGTGDKFAEADLDNGQQMFKNTCGGCHTMQAAGTQGTLGPNLDDSFRSDRLEGGMHDAQFAGVVKRWIEIAQDPMPRNLVTGQDAVDVAAYVGKVAGTQEESAIRKAEPEPPEAPNPPRLAEP